jgi:glutathione S-transferase
MLTLYSKSTCPFSRRIVEVAEKLKIDLEVKEIDESEVARIELFERSKGEKVPCLIDTDRKNTLFETNDIIEYIRENYINSGLSDVVSKSRIHIGDSVCESCEG